MDAFNALSRCMAALARSPEGKVLLRERDHVFQIELQEGDSFYLEISGGDVQVKRGMSPLDWKRRDWDKASTVWTTQETLMAILLGKRTAGEAIFSSRLGLAPRGKKDVNAWFLNLLRAAREQLQRESVESLLVTPDA